jgi:hypothetical protein
MKRLLVNFKFVIAVIFLAATSSVAFATEEEPNQPPKPTILEVQKVVQTISGDKKKLQAYCELGKLQEQMEKAQEKNDTKLIDDLFAKADSLEQQLGPNYAIIADGIGDLDPNSAEGKKFAAVFEPLNKQCR